MTGEEYQALQCSTWADITVLYKLCTCAHRHILQWVQKRSWELPKTELETSGIICHTFYMKTCKSHWQCEIGCAKIISKQFQLYNCTSIQSVNTFVAEKNSHTYDIFSRLHHTGRHKKWDGAKTVHATLHNITFNENHKSYWTAYLSLKNQVLILPTYLPYQLYMFFLI